MYVHLDGAYTISLQQENTFVHLLETVFSK